VRLANLRDFSMTDVKSIGHPASQAQHRRLPRRQLLHAILRTTIHRFTLKEKIKNAHQKYK